MMSPFLKTRVGDTCVRFSRPSSISPTTMQLYRSLMPLSMSVLPRNSLVEVDDELAELHLALFYFSLLRQQVALQGGVEFLQLVVVADYLQFVAREDDHVAVRDVQAVGTAVNAAQVNTETLAQMQLSQRFASPTAIFRHFKFADVDIPGPAVCPRRAAAFRRSPEPQYRANAGCGRRRAPSRCYAS